MALILTLLIVMDQLQSINHKNWHFSAHRLTTILCQSLNLTTTIGNWTWCFALIRKTFSCYLYLKMSTGVLEQSLKVSNSGVLMEECLNVFSYQTMSEMSTRNLSLQVVLYFLQGINRYLHDIFGYLVYKAKSGLESRNWAEKISHWGRTMCIWDNLYKYI